MTLLCLLMTTKTFTSTISTQLVINSKLPTACCKPAVEVQTLLPSRNFNYSAAGPAPAFRAPEIQPSTGILTLNTSTGSIDTTQSVEHLKYRFSLSTEANGSGTIFGAIDSLNTTADSVQINLNEGALSAYDNQNLYLNYSDPTSLDAGAVRNGSTSSKPWRC